MKANLIALKAARGKSAIVCKSRHPRVYDTSRWEAAEDVIVCWRTARWLYLAAAMFGKPNIARHNFIHELSSTHCSQHEPVPPSSSVRCVVPIMIAAAACYLALARFCIRLIFISLISIAHNEPIHKKVLMAGRRAVQAPQKETANCIGKSSRMRPKSLAATI